ncbi:Alpha/Beta hydrolase protein [Ilyonectria destructans]|nr:Alpha/Beta hydrolase protein [Ilyonectria destructans]
MASLGPTGSTQHHVPTLGTINGLVFSGGIRQFCGIPYAELTKRWTRSTLKTHLPGDFHDGTQHGPITPQPPEYKDLIGGLVPAPPLPHFKTPKQAEFDCLNLNVVLPPEDSPGPHPVMVWIHGGSFLMGASTHPAYDMVNFVSYAVKRGTPVVGVSISYRVGLFGFLASQAIKEDLCHNGFEGAGNFGLTDQQTALAWVQKYIGAFGGNPDNVTIFGESAGGMSVAHQVWAAQPATFHRAISLSGTLNTIPAWSLERHECRWKALLKHLGIDPLAADVLDQLRAVPQQDVADATCLIEGTNGTTGNTCNDGWFHNSPPSTSSISSPPDWLKSYMVGDVKDEAIIFRSVVADETYDTLRTSMARFLNDAETDAILAKYDIYPGLPTEHLPLKFEDMASDSLFKIQNRIHISVSGVPKRFGFHMDQLSTLETPFKGLAGHAVDVSYFFLNLRDALTEAEQHLGEKMAADFLNFAYGKDPWNEYSRNSQWMVYGPNDRWAVKTESEDELTRRYKRMDEILKMGTEVVERWVEATDYIVNKRWKLETA